MPTYEYRCSNENCKNIMDFFSHKILSENEIPCEKCGSPANREVYASMLARTNPEFLAPGKIDRRIEDRGWNNEKPEYHFEKKDEYIPVEKKKSKKNKEK